MVSSTSIAPMGSNSSSRGTRLVTGADPLLEDERTAVIIARGLADVEDVSKEPPRLDVEGRFDCSIGLAGLFLQSVQQRPRDRPALRRRRRLGTCTATS